MALLWKCPGCDFISLDQNIISNHCFHSFGRMLYQCPCDYKHCNTGLEAGQVDDIIQHLQNCQRTLEKLPTRDSITNPRDVRSFLLKPMRTDLKKGSLRPVLSQVAPPAPMQRAQAAPPSSIKRATPKAPVKRARQDEDEHEDEQRSKRRRGLPQCAECYRKRVQCKHLGGGGRPMTTAPRPGPISTPTRTPFTGRVAQQGAFRPIARPASYTVPATTHAPTKTGMSSGALSQDQTASAERLRPVVSSSPTGASTNGVASSSRLSQGFSSPPAWPPTLTPARDPTSSGPPQGLSTPPVRRQQNAVDTPAAHLTRAPTKDVVDLTGDSDEESDVAEHEHEQGDSQLNGSNFKGTNEERQSFPNQPLFAGYDSTVLDLDFLDNQQDGMGFERSYQRDFGSWPDVNNNWKVDESLEPEHTKHLAGTLGQVQTQADMPQSTVKTPPPLGPVQAQLDMPTFVMKTPPPGPQSLVDLNNLLRQANHTPEQAQAVDRVFISAQYRDGQGTDGPTPPGFHSWNQVFDDWLQLRKADHTPQQAQAVESIFWWVCEPVASNVKTLPDDALRVIDEIEHAGTDGGGVHSGPAELSPAPQLASAVFPTQDALNVNEVDNEPDSLPGDNINPNSPTTAGGEYLIASASDRQSASPDTHPLHPAHDADPGDEGDEVHSGDIDTARGESHSALPDIQQRAAPASQPPPDREVVYISDSDDEGDSLFGDDQDVNGGSEHADAITINPSVLNVAPHAERHPALSGWRDYDEDFGEEAMGA